jgi:phage-related protein
MPLKYCSCWLKLSIEQQQKRLLYYQKTVWKRVKSMLTPLQNFLKNIISEAKKLIDTVGKKVINHITSTIQAILKLFEPIEKALKYLIQTGKSILNTIRKQVNKSEAIPFLKKVIRKYVETFRKVVDWVIELWSELGILDAALAVLNKFRMMLRLVFQWFDDVTGILSAVKNFRTLLRGTIKTLKEERNDTLRLGKDVAKLKAT